MDGPKDDYTNWSKSERERQILYDINYMWDLKYDTNKQTHRHRKQTYVNQRGKRVKGGGDKGRAWD